MLERDRRDCPKHGLMTLFDLVKETENGAVRQYHCLYCDHEDTIEVSFVPEQFPDPASRTAERSTEAAA